MARSTARSSARAAFSDAEQRARINALVHPPVIAALLRTMETLPPGVKRSPYIIVEAALLYESGMDKMLDVVIVVHASEAIRINRLLTRDTTTRTE